MLDALVDNEAALKEMTDVLNEIMSHETMLTYTARANNIYDTWVSMQ